MIFNFFKNPLVIIGVSLSIIQLLFGTNLFPYNVSETDIKWNVLSNGKFVSAKGKYGNSYIIYHDNNGERVLFNPLLVNKDGLSKLRAAFEKNNKVKIGWYPRCFKRTFSVFGKEDIWEGYRKECRVFVGIRSAENNMEIIDFRETLKILKDDYIKLLILNYLHLIFGILFVVTYLIWLFYKKGR